MTARLDTQTRREQIAQAAMDLAAVNGVSSITVGRVARLVGLSPSALYRHFRNKEDLILGMIRLMGKRLLGFAQAARKENTDSLNKLKSLLMQHIRLATHFKAIPQILFSDHVFIRRNKSRALLFEAVENYLHEIRIIIEEGQAEGSIRPELSSRDLSLMFLGLFQPSIFLHHLSGGEYSMIDHAQSTWNIFEASARRE